MSERSKEKQAGGKTAATARRDRLAAELRANLKKRKARTRAAAHGESGDTKKSG